MKKAVLVIIVISVAGIFFIYLLKSIKNPHLRGLYFPQFDKKNFNHL